MALIKAKPFCTPTPRFILQDLPKIISQIDDAQAKKDGFEPMAHYLFTPQPVKGAKYYHLRRVLHDWNDGPSIKILEATRAAMNALLFTKGMI